MSDKSSSKELPKQYDQAAAQGRWYRFWEENGYFHSEPRADKKPYTIVIPPPNVTGALHLGHALNNTLQDILIRQKRMQGFETLWVPGTDHAGIATQAVVERRLLTEEKKTRHDLGREGLIERIWNWKEEYEARILGQLKRMGCSCDWERTRFTLDQMCTRAVRRTFFSLFNEQLIYRGKRLVNWDTLLQTAVSDDEVFHETIPGNFWHFHYPIVHPASGEPKYVKIATTRPETMLGDTAVAVHPAPATRLDTIEADLRERLLAAPEKTKQGIQSQIDDILQRREELLPELIKLRDMAQEGRKVMLPLMDREIPLIVDEWAKPEMGTGCVKITPAHDANDYEVGLRRNLPMINLLNPDGTLNSNAGKYSGQKVQKARKSVLADLDELGLLVETEDREIDLAHSDRSKAPIEPMLNDQWFVKMDQLAQTAMDAVTSERVKIFPKRYTKGYLDWLSEKRDWPVSRQLWWGHRIPIWYTKTPTEEDLEKAFSGRDDVVWYRDDEYGQWLICAEEQDLDEHSIPGHKITREEDVLDTWFSSALWPHSTLGWPEKTKELEYYYPTATLITSRDIITLWVARMVLAGLHNVGNIPFNEVFIHPKILDGFGEGMSKSKGNGVDPIDVMEKFGADSLRFGLAYLTTETQDIRIPVEFECPHCNKLVKQTKKNRILPKIECPDCKKYFSTQWAEKPEDKQWPRGPVVSDRFEIARNFCNKLWNASRFALMNLEGYTIGPVGDDELMVEDRWILSRLSTVTQSVTNALAEYRYADATRVLYEFAWDEFCSFFVEMVKGRLQDEKLRPVAQKVLAHTLDTLLRLLHPIIPFVTEEVWQLLAEYAPERGISKPVRVAESVMIAPWPMSDTGQQDKQIESQFLHFQKVLRAVRDIRSRQNVPPKTKIEFAVRCDREMAESLKPMRLYFEPMAGAHLAGLGPEVIPPALSANVNLTGIDVYVDLAELIDVEAEMAQKRAERDKLDGMIIAKQKKLKNENFVSRAPEAVVLKERNSLKDLEEQRSATVAVLKRLATIK